MDCFPKPYQDLDDQAERVVRACYASLLERGTPYDAEELRFKERVDDSFLQRLVELHLLSPRDSGYRPTVVGLLYLPEAERDLQALDSLVRLAHQKYRPHAPPLDSEEVRKTLHLEHRDFDRLGNLAQDLGLGWVPREPSQPARPISLYEWMAKVPDLTAALLERLGPLYRATEAAEHLPAPAPFDLRPRRLRVKGFRALKDIELSTPGLTALVGPNGVGKSTVLDAFVFLRNAVLHGADVAVKNEAGIDRLKTRGWRGPVELVLEFNLDYGDHEPVAGEYQVSIDDLRGRVVVEKERLDVARRDGTMTTLVDGRRGRCRLADPAGNYHELLQSAGTLTLSRLDPNSQQDYPIATDLREALTEIVLIDRDPVFRAGLGLNVFVAGEDRKRRGAEPVDQILGAVVAEKDLVDKLARVAKEFIPDIETIRRVVRTGREPELEVVERGGGELRVEELSAGTRQLLLLAAIWLRPRPPTLVLLEEPDAGVHPGGHTALRDLLRSIAKRSVVILTTHSPAFVGLLDPETEVIALERGPDGVQLRSFAAAMRQSGWLKAFGTGADAFVRSASEKKP
jgi:predicted ATPase